MGFSNFQLYMYDFGIMRISVYYLKKPSKSHHPNVPSWKPLKLASEKSFGTIAFQDLITVSKCFNYFAFNILRKDIFIQRFIPNEKINF